MARKGDKLTDFVTANWYNEVSRRLRIPTGPRGGVLDHQTSYITVRNHAAVAKGPFDVVALDDLEPDYNAMLTNAVTPGRPVYNTKALSTTEPLNFLPLLEPLAPEIGATARAVVSGWCWINVPTALVAGFPYLRYGASGLEYWPVGFTEVLAEFTHPTSGYVALCVIGPLHTAVATFVTGGSGIPAKSGSTLGSATCTLVNTYGGTRVVTAKTDTVYNDFKGSINSSTDIQAAWKNDHWEVIAEDCNDGPSAAPSLLEFTVNATSVPPV